jgi:hypothetical protein
MLGFGKAVAWGTLAGAALPLVLTTILVILSLPDLFSGQMSIWQTLYLLFLPLIVVFPIVLLACIIFGLPLTALLKWMNRERLSLYVWIGFAIGLLLPVAILVQIGASDGYWMAALGAISGTVTGNVWWTEARESHAFSSKQTPPRAGEEA